MYENMVTHPDYHVNSVSEAESIADSWDSESGIKNSSWWWMRYPSGQAVDKTGKITAASALGVSDLNSLRPAIWVYYGAEYLTD